MLMLYLLCASNAIVLMLMSLHDCLLVWSQKLLWLLTCAPLTYCVSLLLPMTVVLLFVQAQGTAIWLIAYFGYWLEIFFVILCKALTGTLTAAGVNKKQLKVSAKDKAARTSESSEDSTIKADAPVPQGKGVTAGDFIVGPDIGGQKSKFAHNSDSGSSSSETPAVHQVQLTDLQSRH